MWAPPGSKLCSVLAPKVSSSMEKSRHRSVASPSYLGRRISICWEEESVSVGKKSQYLLGRRVSICWEEESGSVVKKSQCLLQSLNCCKHVGQFNVGQFRCGAVQVCSAMTAICERDNVLQKRPGQRTRKQMKKSKDREGKENKMKGSDRQDGRTCHWETTFGRFQMSVSILFRIMWVI